MTEAKLLTEIARLEMDLWDAGSGCGMLGCTTCSLRYPEKYVELQIELHKLESELETIDA